MANSSKHSWRKDTRNISILKRIDTCKICGLKRRVPSIHGHTHIYSFDGTNWSYNIVVCKNPNQLDLLGYRSYENKEGEKDEEDLIYFSEYELEEAEKSILQTDKFLLDVLKNYNKVHLDAIASNSNSNEIYQPVSVPDHIKNDPFLQEVLEIFPTSIIIGGKW